MIKLIVHGGAWNIPDEYDEDHMNGIKKALILGKDMLTKSGTALDVVEKVVNVLEEDPTFDAGRGSFLNEKGEIEMDALICDGQNLRFGAVAAIQNFLHPVSIAKAIMQKTEHHLIVGKGAKDFAIKNGFKQIPHEQLLTDRELALYQSIKKDTSFKTINPFKPSPKGTVGAVALDKYGNLASATSTGGTALKMKGRVGDTAIFGAGGYANNNLGAASATGWGESIMRVLLCYTVVQNMRMGKVNAAEIGILKLANEGEGFGGVIGITKEGEYSFAHNSQKMAHGFLSGNEIITQLRK